MEPQREPCRHFLGGMIRGRKAKDATNQVPMESPRFSEATTSTITSDFCLLPPLFGDPIQEHEIQEHDHIQTSNPLDYSFFWGPVGAECLSNPEP